MRIKIIFVLLFICLLTSYTQVRHEINIPKIPGYHTLKCDFHIHTIFSDGSVWPTTRVDEAYIEGLDVIAITEHIEYRPHHKNGDMKSDHNRAFELVKSRAKELSILVIQGSEITRGMPPGHSNALFLRDCNPLDTPKYEDAFEEAAKQKAFIFWNHPGWVSQAYETTKWYDEHTRLYEKGYMQGIEVANSTDDYYPEAHQWALDKNLTIFGNSDIHLPIGMEYNFAYGDHRTMTLVFAKERTIESIHEALDNRRTVAWTKNIVVGREDLLRELFRQTFRIENIQRTKTEIRLVVKNDSDFMLKLVKSAHDMNLNYFRELYFEPGERKVINIGLKQLTSAKVKIDFTVENFYVGPNEGLDYSIEIEAEK